jgi:LytS/YehU family sensor histidine kinase
VILARLTRNTERTFTPALAEDTLQIWVRDTGAGASEQELAHGRTRGIGLQNVEQRIKRHYGDAATFEIRSAPDIGTTVELCLPVNLAPEKLVRSATAVVTENTRRKIG